MSNAISRCFDTRTDSFAMVRTWLENFCTRTQTSPHNTWQLTLIIEELFVNSMKHGYAGVQATEDQPRQVWIALTHNPEGIDVCYEDAAFEFNPLTDIRLPDYSGPAESWRVGGLGLHMVAEIAKNMRYQRKANRNSLRLTLPASEK